MLLPTPPLPEATAMMFLMCGTALVLSWLPGVRAIKCALTLACGNCSAMAPIQAKFSSALPCICSEGIRRVKLTLCPSISRFCTMLALTMSRPVCGSRTARRRLSMDSLFIIINVVNVVNEINVVNCNNC